MKSPIIQQSDYIRNKQCYSELTVMKSAAGWYVGTWYTNSDGSKEPGSRDTGYFNSPEMAEAALAEIIDEDSQGLWIDGIDHDCN